MPNTGENKGNRSIVIWLFTGVAMIIVHVLLGGITRLHGLKPEHYGDGSPSWARSLP